MTLSYRVDFAPQTGHGNGTSMDAVEERKKRSAEVRARGEMSLIASLCRVCSHIIPRVADWRVLEPKYFCHCGPKTTIAEDYAAHGLPAVFLPAFGKVTE